jgi:hypothetical protein
MRQHGAAAAGAIVLVVAAVFVRTEHAVIHWNGAEHAAESSTGS